VGPSLSGVVGVAWPGVALGPLPYQSEGQFRQSKPSLVLVWQEHTRLPLCGYMPDGGRHG
jgi:hypothetical protein